MLPIIIPIACLILSFIFMLMYDKIQNWQVSGEGLRWIGGILLFITLFATPLTRLTINQELAEREAFEMTLQNARENGLNNYENAAITTRIADWNEYQAKIQYFRNKKLQPWTGIFIPKKVDEMKMIE